MFVRCNKNCVAVHDGGLLRLRRMADRFRSSLPTPVRLNQRKVDTRATINPSGAGFLIRAVLAAAKKAACLGNAATVV